MSDPYELLGVSRNVSEAELHSAYRRLVKLHHPDHNRGSADAARRFEQIQDAYAQIRQERKQGPPAAQPPPTYAADPAVESRLADLERELRAAHAAREAASRAARAAAAAARVGDAGGREAERRASDEELGYVETDDSFAKIFADARAELADRLADEIEGLSSKLGRRPPPKSG